MKNINYIENWLKENLSSKRFNHSLGCADTAQKLAKLYNLDEKTYRYFSSCFAGERKIDLDWVEKNTVIIHFNGKKKPWKEQKYTGRLGDFFEKYKLL